MNDDFYHVSFRYFISESSSDNWNFKESYTKYLYLLDSNYYYNILEFMPRLFTITTNNGSSKFNHDMLIDSSDIISFHFGKTKINEYHLNINDESNVLQKFEQLYQGETIYFTKEDIPVAKQITSLLKIRRIPRFLRKCDLNDPYYYEGEGEPISSGISLDKYRFNCFLSKNIFNSFTISTKHKEYSCNCYGIYSSEILKEILTKDPFLDSYYYDYEDENCEFQLICDFFNFEKVQMTKNNMNNLLKFATDFKIEKIIDKINKYIESSETISSIIDEQQNLIDSINNLFNLLYHIKDQQISNIVSSIVGSFWSQTEENVLEMAAFILQVIKNKISLHSYIVDLLIELNNQSNKNNKLEILIPFIVKKLMQSFGESLQNCSFVFNLYKREIISKELLMNHLMKIQNESLDDDFDFENYCNNDETYYRNILTWFMPELNEIGLFNKIHKKMTNKLSSYILNFMPDKIDDYIRMRDSGEPDDELTKSLRNDDIDSFKSVVLKKQIDIQKGMINFNIFDDFFQDQNIMYYLNYSAAYGSLKCFKYLYLNHVEINESTYSHAISGGNIEIIKIVDQKIKIKPVEFNSNEIYFREDKSKAKLKIIYPTIINHQYEIFDWILENKFSIKELSDQHIVNITDLCIENGNIHSLIEIIDKGFCINYKNSFEWLCRYGFYRMSQIILNISKKDSSPINDVDIRYSAFYDNLSIFKLCLELSEKQKNLEKSLFLSIKKESFNITKYILENHLIETTNITIRFCLYICVIYGSVDAFNYLLSKYDQASDPNYMNALIYILNDACLYSQNEIIKIIIDLIKLNSTNYRIDLSEAFINSAKSGRKEICRYIFNTNFYISIDEICSKCNELSEIDKEIFSLFYNNSSQFDKQKLHHFYLNKAIIKNNKELVEFLLLEKADHEKALIIAVNTKSIEMVNLILKFDSRASFVNKRTKSGSALNIAVSIGKLDIVQRLLSVPNIDTNIYDYKLQTPFMIASELKIYDILIAFIDFHKDNILILQPYLNELIEKIFTKMSKPTKIDPKIYDLFYKIIENKSIDIGQFIQKYYFNMHTINCKFSEIIENMIKTDKIDVNLCNPNNGDSLLMHFIQKKKIDIVDILIKNPKTNINHRNYDDSTALIIAVKNKFNDIIDLLINDEKFDPNESCINYAFFLSTDENANKLYSINSLDVNYVYFNNQIKKMDKEIYETTLTNAVKLSDLKKIDLILQHQSFDKDKSCIQKAITFSVINNQIEIFRKLFKLIDNDINSYNDNNNSLVDLVIDTQNADVLLEIINKINFNPDSFLNVFLKLFDIKEQSYKMMVLLYEYDKENDELINFNELLPNGKSFFTSIQSENDSKKSYLNIEKIIDFLLQNGANPNMPDKFNVYPLEYAIETKSIEFVSALLNSSKIDFSVKLKPNKKTFLHLAAESNFKIFKLILNKNVIDINSIDENGETPLMQACRCRKKKIIKLLFSSENLDFLHCNKKGEDAFEILSGIKSKQKLSKPKYFQRLMSKL